MSSKFDEVLQDNGTMIIDGRIYNIKEMSMEELDNLIALVEQKAKQAENECNKCINDMDPEDKSEFKTVFDKDIDEK